MSSRDNGMSALRRRLEQSIVIAIDNIAAHGDTDIFPPPDEAVLLFCDREEAAKKVMALHDDFVSKDMVSSPDLIRCLVPAGYLGQRLATQIPPLWNAYYLAIIIACAPDIERIRVSSSMVFSYRFMSPNTGDQIFDTKIGWAGFMEATVCACTRYSHALVTDIADFYHRIRIKTVAQAMERANMEVSLRELLVKILVIFDVDRYGLPVGGPGSRLLAELVLARTDGLLYQKRIPFIRFVDDIRLFANSEGDAQRHLLALASLLWEDGFSLHKSKTRMTRSGHLIEEVNLSRATVLSSIEGSETSPETAVLLPHDPYSEMRAQMDLQLSRFALRPDSVSTIMREFAKSRLNVSLCRNLISSVSHLPSEQAGEVLAALLEVSDSLVLIPVFSRLMEGLESNLDRLPPLVIDRIRDRLVVLAFGDEAVAAFDFHRALCIRLIGLLPLKDVHTLTRELEQLEVNTVCGLVRREIAAVRGRRGIPSPIVRQCFLAGQL